MEEQLGKYEKADVNTDMTDRRDEVLRDVQEAIDDAIGILSRANEGEGRNEMQRTYMGILESPVEDIEGIIRMIPEELRDEEFRAYFANMSWIEMDDGSYANSFANMHKKVEVIFELIKSRARAMGISDEIIDNEFEARIKTLERKFAEIKADINQEEIENPSEIDEVTMDEIVQEKAISSPIEEAINEGLIERVNSPREITFYTIKNYFKENGQTSMSEQTILEYFTRDDGTFDSEKLDDICNPFSETTWQSLGLIVQEREVDGVIQRMVYTEMDRQHSLHARPKAKSKEQCDGEIGDI